MLCKFTKDLVCGLTVTDISWVADRIYFPVSFHSVSPQCFPPNARTKSNNPGNDQKLLAGVGPTSSEMQHDPEEYFFLMFCSAAHEEQVAE